MEESILKTTKLALGILPDYEAFDEEIMMHINSVFSILHQLGIGPTIGFSISSKDDIWEDFISDNEELYNLVKSYMYLKVRMIFDPPALSFTQNAFNDQITQFEYRMNVVREQAIIEAQEVEA